MKSIILSLFLGVTGILNMPGKVHDYHGVYWNESGTRSITVKQDTITIKSYDEDTGSLAVCSCKRISDEFMEINSIDYPMVEAFRNMSITYAKNTGEILDPNETVRFILPNRKSDMKVILQKGLKDYVGIVMDGICEINIDRNLTDITKSFTFTLVPMEYEPSNPAGQYFGLLYISYPFGIQCKDNDIIEIELPDVDGHLFESYFLKGEYVHFIKDGLEWKGECYHKE